MKKFISLDYYCSGDYDGVVYSNDNTPLNICVHIDAIKSFALEPWTCHVYKNFMDRRRDEDNIHLHPTLDLFCIQTDIPTNNTAEFSDKYLKLWVTEESFKRLIDAINNESWLI